MDGTEESEAMPGSCFSGRGYRIAAALLTLVVVATLGVGVRHVHEFPVWDSDNAPRAETTASDGGGLTCWSCSLAHSPVSRTISCTGALSAELTGIRLVSVPSIFREWRSRTHASRGPPALV